jgi:hypothetical protein
LLIKNGTGWQTFAGARRRNIEQAANLTDRSCEAGRCAAAPMADLSELAVL